jgi:hypothetical protein
MIAPTVFSMIWFSVFGAAGIQADNQTNGAISSATGTSEALGLFAYLQQNPLFLLTSISMIFLVWIFFVAGADAGTIVLGSMSAGSVLNPKRLIKLTCAATRPENLSARRCRTPATAGRGRVEPFLDPLVSISARRVRRLVSRSTFCLLTCSPSVRLMSLTLGALSLCAGAPARPRRRPGR